jgi:hypothetical protein
MDSSSARKFFVVERRMVVDRSMRLIKRYGLFVSAAVLPNSPVPLSLESHRLAVDPLGYLPPEL